MRRSQEKRGPSGERFCSLGPPQPTAALYRIVEDSVEIYASSDASEERAFASHLAQKARRVRRTCNEPHWGAAYPGKAGFLRVPLLLLGNAAAHCGSFSLRGA